GRWDDTEQVQYFTQKWRDQRFEILQIEQDGETIRIGAIWVDLHGTDLWLREIQIEPHYQGRGLGTALIRALIERANTAEQGIVLRVLRHNRARYLYQRLGFEFSDTHTDTHFWMQYRVH
ncbi:MAG: GNAT family N-acetyltransferase, partial [Gammaproteobacteria bacterium]|nr:GNAT family N-acetyltransferase [Gammaproteobacteria bacterium]